MKKKTVAIAGSSGLIGSYLSSYLQGYEILKINRQDFKLEDKKIAEKFREADIIINLAGSTVIRRWAKKNRKEILDSRILTTRKLGSIMDYYPERERIYLSASAIGIYNDEDIHTEESTDWGKGFMAEVVNKWETEVRNIENKRTTVCLMRIGVVLAHSSGMLARLLPIFRMGLGARIGSGDQYFSWIHINDLARAIDFIISRKKGGVYNMTAPEYSTNREFTMSISSKLKKPARFILPKVLLRLLYGRGADVVTGGQAVIPERLIKEGFQFNYHYVDKALEDIVN
ncbi:MAG: TIGR01777 family oxidoreductase [Bacteroidales bacterium]|nr:TIGR01777 family oxidoreductase [Bacteroidales bacterium]